MSPVPRDSNLYRNCGVTPLRGSTSLFPSGSHVIHRRTHTETQTQKQTHTHTHAHTHTHLGNLFEKHLAPHEAFNGHYLIESSPPPWEEIK